MKACLDNICIAGKTYKYTETGSVGLLNDKKAVHIQARGGVYSEGPAADVEMGDKYINDRQSIIIEGMAAAPDKAAEIKANAINRAQKVAETF